MLYAIFGLWLLTFVLVAMQTKRQKEGGLARMEWKLDALLKKLEVTLPNLDVDPALLELVRSGRKIEAIKRYREITGAELKDAKEFVERLR